MNKWLRHPVATWRNQRDDRQVFALVWAIAALGGKNVEHEKLRDRMGWPARRFDYVSDMAINIGFIDYLFDFAVAPMPGGQAPVSYHLTQDGRAVIAGQVDQ